MFSLIGFGVRMALPALLACAAVCVMSSSSAKAAVVLGYNFQASNGNASTTVANTTPGTFSGTGLTVTYGTTPWTGGTIGIRANTASMPTAQNTANYFSFSITPNSGYVLNLGGTGALTLDYGRNLWALGAVFNWSLYSSLDSYGSSITTGSASTQSALNSASVTLSSSFNNIGSSGVTFRLYVWDGNSVNNTTTYGYFDNVALNGTVAPVPEPINYALAVFGLVFAGGSAGRFYLGRRRSATTS
jgi:hypothetical protein